MFSCSSNEFGKGTFSKNLTRQAKVIWPKMPTLQVYPYRAPAPPRPAPAQPQDITTASCLSHTFISLWYTQRKNDTCRYERKGNLILTSVRRHYVAITRRLFFSCLFIYFISSLKVVGKPFFSTYHRSLFLHVAHGHLHRVQTQSTQPLDRPLWNRQCLQNLTRTNEMEKST